MRVTCLFLIALSSVAASSIHAQGAQTSLLQALADSHQKSPIQAFRLDVRMLRMTVLTGSLSAQAGEHDEFERSMEDVHSLSEKMDADIEPAVRSVKGKAELAKAVKDYYSAASAYAANGIPANRLEKAISERLEAELEIKEKRLDLEMKLAGAK